MGLFTIFRLEHGQRRPIESELTCERLCEFTLVQARRASRMFESSFNICVSLARAAIDELIDDIS